MAKRRTLRPMPPWEVIGRPVLQSIHLGPVICIGRHVVQAAPFSRATCFGYQRVDGSAIALGLDSLGHLLGHN